jgi:hypothetical protein
MVPPENGNLEWEQESWKDGIPYLNFRHSKKVHFPIPTLKKRKGIQSNYKNFTFFLFQNVEFCPF